MPRAGVSLLVLFVVAALTFVVQPGGVDATTAVECATANDDGTYTVPFDWALKPAGLARGDQFRLLFVTSQLRDADGAGLGVYNTFVQDSAKVGHQAISDSCASQFKVVGSTRSRNARSNTGMWDPTANGGAGGHADADSPIPVYWMNGARLADGYADFYDGSWGNYDKMDENGRSVSYTEVVTGSQDDGTRLENYEIDSSFRQGTDYFYDERVATGSPTGEGSPLSGGRLAFTESLGRFYALSPVFVVEKPTIGFSNTAITVNEGSATVNLRVELSHPRPEATSFAVTATAGTATAGADYTAGPVAATIPAGRTETMVSIGIVNDTVAERWESFSAEITGLADGATPEPEHTTAEIRIVDDDGAGRLVITPSAPLELTEGGSGTYTVKLASPPTHDVTVQINSNDPDVTTSPQTLTFMPGNWNAAQTVTVNSKLDYDIWDDTATLTHITESMDPNYDGSASITRKQVEVPDRIIEFYPPTLSFRDANVTVSEYTLVRRGERFVPFVQIGFVLSEYLVGTGYVTITATSGTATAGEDFRPFTRRVYIASGMTEYSIRFQFDILDDNLLEEDETFTLTLSDPTRAVLGERTTMTVTITDDEYRISSASGKNTTYVAENVGDAEVKFNLSKALPRDIKVSVDYDPYKVGIGFALGGATLGRDFRLGPRSVTVPAGQTEFTVRIPIIDDDIGEGALNPDSIPFRIIPDKAPRGEDTRLFHTLVIQDDDNDKLRVSTTPTFFEGQTKTITIENVPSAFGFIQPEQNFYFITDNVELVPTATIKRNPDQRCTDWRDYNSDGIDICFKDHHWDNRTRTASIRITALRDREVEGDETVYLRFGKHLNYGSNTHVLKITITDHPTEYRELTDTTHGNFWCEEPIPSVADVFLEPKYHGLTEAERMEYLEAVEGTPQIWAPPPVLLAEWDQDNYEEGDTATIRFRAQDKDGNPVRVCGSVTIGYGIDSTPASAGAETPIHEDPADPLERRRQATIRQGQTETAVSFPIQAGTSGEVSFHINSAGTRDGPVPMLKDGDGMEQQTGHKHTATVSCPAPCPSNAEAPPPEVNIVGAFSGNEGNQVGFTLGADPAPAAGKTLDISVTITATGDFGVQTGTRTITIGQSGYGELLLNTTDDEVTEPDGSVTLTINPSPGAYTLGLPSVVTTSIDDNDGPGDGLNEGTPTPATDVLEPPLEKPEITISGGSGITEGGTATFTITADPAPASPITVNVGVTQDGSWDATGSATVTVSGATATYTITTSDDSVDEADGSVTATVQTGSGYTIGTPASASVPVSDDDNPPPATPEITISGGSGITEGGTATFTITADPAPASPITVNVGVTQDGSWDATGSATVTVSGATATYTITTSDDSVDEADGSVTATVQTGSGYTIGTPASASVPVSDDDNPPPATPEITISGGSGITEGGTATFTITADPAPASPITVNVGVTQDGSWDATGSATVTVSGATATYTITTSDDSVDEADGSVTATVQTGSGYTIGTPASASVPVSDDDVPAIGNSGTLTVAIENPEERAGRGEFLEFTISASEAAKQEVTISYMLSNIRLAPGLDYCVIASGEHPDEDFNCSDNLGDVDTRRGEVTIAAGEDTATIFIWIDRDAWVNAGAQVLVFLTDVEGANEITEGYASGRVTE